MKDNSTIFRIDTPWDAPEIAVIKNRRFTSDTAAGRHTRKTFIKAATITCAEVSQGRDVSVLADRWEKGFLPSPHTEQGNDLAAKFGQDLDFQQIVFKRKCFHRA
jgi:hypothetical protein